MDRLIIESALTDVNEIFLAGNNTGNIASNAIVLGFKATNMDQVVNAFSALKQIAEKHPIEFIICKTMVNGIYDMEIKTDGLDEPIRIMNKAISHETLGAIEDQINKGREIVLSTNVSQQENHINVYTAHIKECEFKH